LSEERRGLISKVLAPACTLLLRSQVSAVDRLEVKIDGGNRQILGGSVPGMSALAEAVVYKGLHVSKLDLQAESIRINLPQVMRGQPLKILDPIELNIDARLSSADLKQSLNARLLKTALTDLFQQILPAAKDLTAQQFDWQELDLQKNRLDLRGTISNDEHLADVSLTTYLSLESGRYINLSAVKIDTTLEIPGKDIDVYQIDIGKDAILEELIFQDGEIHCRGKIVVYP
jgi:hypothetical protein